VREECGRNPLPLPGAPVECPVVVVADNCTDSHRGAGCRGRCARACATQTSLSGVKVTRCATAFDQLQAGRLRLRFFFSWWMRILFVSLKPDRGGGALSRNRQPCHSVAATVSELRAHVATRLMDCRFSHFNTAAEGPVRLGSFLGILATGSDCDARRWRRSLPMRPQLLEDLGISSAAGHRGVNAVDFIGDATVFRRNPVRERRAKGQRSRWEGGRCGWVREWVPAMVAWVIRRDWT